MNEEDVKLTIPPGVSGNISGTLKISVDEIYWIIKPPEKDYFVELTWWGGKNHHYFYPEDVTKSSIVHEGKNDIIFQIRTSRGLFETYLFNCKQLNFNLLSTKNHKILGTAQVKCYERILSLKPFVAYYPVISDKKRIADLCIAIDLSFFSGKLNADIEEEYGFVEAAGSRRSKSYINTSKALEQNEAIISNIVSKGQELRKAMLSSILASCDFETEQQFEDYKNNMPCLDMHDSKSEDIKLNAYLKGEEMTKEEEQEAIKVLRCKSPLPILDNIIESKSSTTIKKDIKSRTIELKEEIPDKIIMEDITPSKEALINSYIRSKQPLLLLIDSYRIGVSNLILTKIGMKKIFNTPDYIPAHLSSKMPSGTTFILEYHSVLSLKKQWTQPLFSLSAKYVDGNAVKFNEFVVKKLKPSLNPWEQINSLCSGSQIKIYCKHSNQKQSFLLAQTEYPSSTNTGYCRKLCLPLQTRYKLHVGNLLLKVDLGIGTIFGDAISELESQKVEPEPIPSRKIVARKPEDFSDQDDIIFNSMSEDEEYANKRPVVLSKNAVSYFDKPKEPLTLKSKKIDEQPKSQDIFLSQLEMLGNKENKSETLKQDFGGSTTTKTSSSIKDYELLESESNIKTNLCHCCCCCNHIYNHQNKTKKEKECKKCQSKQSSMQSWKDEVPKPEKHCSKQEIIKHDQKQEINLNKEQVTLHLYKIKIVSCEATALYSRGELEFFICYDFPIVDPESKTVRFPLPQKQPRIELNGCDYALKHILTLNTSLNDQLRSLTSDCIKFKLYARCYRYKSFKLLIAQAELPLSKLVEWEATYRYKNGDSYDKPSIECVVPLKLKMESDLPSDFDGYNINNLNILIEYQRNKIYENLNTEEFLIPEMDTKPKPKERFIMFDEVEFNFIKKKNNKKGRKISLSDSVLQNGSLVNWKDEFKEPVISTDPTTGELKSSRIENRKQQSFTEDDYWGSKSLEMRHNFSDEQTEFSDFVPASHPPSFIEMPLPEALPENVEMVDITSDDNFNENPFESSSKSKQTWKNQVYSSENSRKSTSSSRSEDIFVRKEKHRSKKDHVKKVPSKKIIDLENTNFDKIKEIQTDCIEINDESMFKSIKSPFKENEIYQDQNSKTRITESKIKDGSQIDTNLPSTSKCFTADRDPDFINMVENNYMLYNYSPQDTYGNLKKPHVVNESPIIISDDEYNLTQSEIERANILLQIDDSPKEKIKKKCHKHRKKNEIRSEISDVENKRNKKSINSRPSTGCRRSKRLSDQKMAILDTSTSSIEKQENVPGRRRSKRLLNTSDEKISILDASISTIENKEDVLDVQLMDKMNNRVSTDTQTKEIDWSRSSIVTLPKLFSARVDVNNAINLPCASPRKKFKKDDEPSSYVAIYAEENGKLSWLKSHTVYNNQNPVYNIGWNVKIASEMLYQPDNEFELNVVVDLKGDKKILKASVDLTTFSAGLSCISGWYSLLNGSESQGQLRLKITPLEDITVFKELWSKAVILKIDNTEERKISAVHVKDEVLEKQITQSLQQTIDKMNQLSDKMETRIENPNESFSMELMEEVSKLNRELDDQPWFKETVETETNNLILYSESLIKSPHALNDLITSTDADNTNRVITIDDSDDAGVDDYFNISRVETLFEAIPKDNLQVASDAIEKIIQDLKNQRINE